MQFVASQCVKNNEKNTMGYPNMEYYIQYILKRSQGLPHEDKERHLKIKNWTCV